MMTATTRFHQHAGAARGRLLLWCGALVLLLQLLALAGHDHELDARAQDCVACSVQGQSHAAPPAPMPALVLDATPLYLAPCARPPAIPHAPRASCLPPPPHAPPASPVFS